MTFFALWRDRNGHGHWSEHRTEEQAHAAMEMILDAGVYYVAQKVSLTVKAYDKGKKSFKADDRVKLYPGFEPAFYGEGG